MNPPCRWLVMLSLAVAGEYASALPDEGGASGVGTVTGEWSALRLFREGNRRLNEGDAKGALPYYRRARELDPGAPEIDLAEGLGQYALGEYAESRRLFERAAASPDDGLVDDAIYSIGTSYHREALATERDLKTRIASLEMAMRRYRSVLDHQSDHAAAREANFKAATTWRKLKQELQKQSERGDQEEKGNEKQEDTRQDQQQNPNDKNDQQQRDSQDQPEDQDQQDQRQDQSRQQEHERRQTRMDDSTREQAKRQLREMMQALRNREKKRRTRVRSIEIVPVEKDW